MRYVLPPAVRQAVLWTVRDYDRLRLQYEEIVESSPPPPDGQPSAHNPRDLVSERAIRVADIGFKVRAIEGGWAGIPGEYRVGIWDNIQYRIPFPGDAALKTYKLWKQRYIWNVAHLLRWW